MIRELINSMTYMYSAICRGKGIVSNRTLQNITVGAHSLMETAGSLAERSEQLTENDKAYLKEAEMIDQQIEEMFVFLQTLEIV